MSGQLTRPCSTRVLVNQRHFPAIKFQTHPALVFDSQPVYAWALVAGKDQQCQSRLSVEWENPRLDQLPWHQFHTPDMQAFPEVSLVLASLRKPLLCSHTRQLAEHLRIIDRDEVYSDRRIVISPQRYVYSQGINAYSRAGKRASGHYDCG